MKRFYITKKQVQKYIDSKKSLLTRAQFYEALISTIKYLKTDNGKIKNSAQIKFFSRVKESLYK